MDIAFKMIPDLLELRLGEERLTHSRLWRLDGDQLSVADE